MTSIFFVSDVHLSSEDEAKRQGFLDFLKYCRENTPTLYILGDLFDLWMGPTQIKTTGYADVADALGELARAGVNVGIVPGNRDFQLDSQFEKEVGVSVLPDSVIIRLDEQNVLLTHGDILCTRDAAYVMYRALSRTRPVMKLYRSLPPRLSKFLAMGIRNHSSRTVGRKPDKTLALVDEQLLRRFKLGIDVIICGHVHSPKHEQYKLNGRTHHLYVLGDWSAKGSYLTYESGTFGHRSFDY